MVALREVRRRSIDLRERNHRRIAHRKTADFARGRQILLEERGRDLQYVGDVVEAVAFVVGGEQFGDIDVEVEKVANRVTVLGPIETMQRRASRVRFGERYAINRC